MSPVTDASNAMHFTAASALWPRKCSSNAAIFLRRFFPALISRQNGSGSSRVLKSLQARAINAINIGLRAPVRGNESIYQLFPLSAVPASAVRALQIFNLHRARGNTLTSASALGQMGLLRLIWKRLTFAFLTFSVSASERVRHRHQLTNPTLRHRLPRYNNIFSNDVVCYLSFFTFIYCRLNK